MSTIHRCLTLLHTNLGGEFPMSDPLATVLGSPQKLLGSLETGMCLMAQSIDGTDKEINMRLPSIGRELERLAKRGVGADMEYRGVRFQFVELAEYAAGVGNGVEGLW